MSEYSSLTNYQTINKSERDITKDFDIKQFNTNFEKNDEDLKEKLKDEYKVKVNKVTNNCDNYTKNENSAYLRYGLIFIGIGFLLLFIGVMTLKISAKYNKPNIKVVEQ